MPEKVNVTDAIALYRGGHSLAQVATLYGVSVQAIWYHMRKLGEPRRTSGETHSIPMNHRAFDQHSETADYWAGFLLADGHVALDKRGNAQPQIELSLSTKDAEHVAKFKAFLGSGHQIVIRHGGGFSVGGTQSRISFRSARVAERLIQLWGGSRLSLERLPVPALASSRNFWRGAVDGDGSLHMARNSVPRLSLCGSRALVESFGDFLLTQGIGVPTVRANGSIFEVRYGGKTAVEVAGCLYSSCVVALDRKLAIVNAFAERKWTRDFYNNSLCA